MNKFGLLLVFATSMTFGQQSANTPQLTPVPPKPTCVVILRNGACADLWKNYNQAVAQRLGEQIKLYANRQAELAAAPLQQQVTDLTKLTSDEQEQIKTLQEQIQADSAAALQAKSDAHTQGLEYGSGIGAGVMLLICGLVFGLRNSSVTKKPQSRAASA
jgi:predicted extracellular nuclease